MMTVVLQLLPFINTKKCEELMLLIGFFAMAFSPVSASLSLSLSSCLAFRFLQVAYVVTQYESFSAFWAECVCMAEWLESVGGGTLSLEHVMKVADQKWILIIKQTAKI